MAKTYQWSHTIPSGSEQAATADDHIRRLRLEIEERMSDIVEVWSDDPVVLKQSAAGAKVGKKRLIHSSAFVVEPSEDNTFNYSDSGLTISNLVAPVRAPLEFPAGVTINGIRWIISNGDTGQVTMKLGAIEFAIGLAGTTICEMITTTAGIHTVDSAALNPFSYAVVDTQLIYLSIDKSGGAQFTLHGVEIIYDTPDSRSTL